MNKTSKILIAVVVIALVAIVIYVSGDKTGSETGFKVGLISILSGEYAAVGQNYANGVILAHEEYNAAHPDAKIELTVEDDGFTGGKGVTAFQKLVSVNKIDALINVSTPTIDSIYSSVSKMSMPVIQGGEQGGEPVADNVFGMFPSSVDSEYDYGVYMRERGIKEMSIVYTNIDAMIRFVDAFKKGFQGTTTDYVVAVDEKDFRTHALKAASAKPKVIGLFMFPQQGAQFLKEYFKVDISKPQYFFDANFQSGLPDYKRILGNLAPLNGALVGTINLPTTDTFKAAYKKRFDTEAGFFSDVGYDSFNVLVKTHSSESKSWIANIQDVEFAGASGVTKFSPTGNRLPDTKMMTIKNGELSDL